jgi:hypothetical protein
MRALPSLLLEKIGLETLMQRVRSLWQMQALAMTVILTRNA